MINTIKSAFRGRFNEDDKRDMLLTSLSEARIISRVKLQESINNSNINLDVQTVLDYLVEDGMINRDDYNIRITSKGRRHIEKGGYRKQSIRESRVDVAFYLSIIAILINLGRLALDFIK